ncbi:MAG: DUF11 domain-containing protein, partial [Verrucomicrobiae bacterium]|nr:DUF11 domain-containing protein [Verrucomicrobiae bacterium]
TAITPAHAAGVVDVVVTNPDEQSDTLSNGFTYVTQVTEPIITSQPQSIAVVQGEPASFTVVCSGEPTPTIQWQLSTSNGKKWKNIAGATDFTYNIAVTSISMDAYLYRAILTNGIGDPVTTEAAKLTVLASEPTSWTDIGVTKSGLYDAGSNSITWTIVVTNLGSDPALAVTAKDTLASGARFVGFEGDGATYLNRGKNIVVNLGDMAAGAEVSFTITTSVVKTISPTSNEVTVTTDSFDIFLDNNTAVCTINW